MIINWNTVFSGIQFFLKNPHFQQFHNRIPATNSTKKNNIIFYKPFANEFGRLLINNLSLGTNSTNSHCDVEWFWNKNHLNKYFAIFSCRFLYQKQRDKDNFLIFQIKDFWLLSLYIVSIFLILGGVAYSVVLSGCLCRCDILVRHISPVQNRLPEGRITGI